MRVLITGAAGLLGRQAAKEYTARGFDVYALNKKELDISIYTSIKMAHINIRPHLVINCAAFTNVDRAETEKEEAFTINGLGPRLLAAACRRHNSTLVQISTDHVFNGQSKSPYLISDPPDPVNLYGASKLMGEQGVRESGCRYYIIRTSWLFGPGGKNFACAILKLARENSAIKVVNDQQGCPTYAPDLARGIADLVQTGIHGAYHYTNTGATSKYDFARKIIDTAGLKTEVEPCRTSQFPRPARRPACSVLNPFPIQHVLGYTPPTWEDAVEKMGKELKAPVVT
ncbi:MAG: dTDP-4-dehydrorhamnose reductase [Peptococcaceae bacterium BRH_c4a]|nr:MAG: dTDP-4-dehydrorhamnose reductase [Peptococcaceae bacterium BRH_c4a]